MSKKIYFDYGSGYEDVTNFIRDDFSITERMSTDSYHYAQNVADMTMLIGDSPAVPDGGGSVYYKDDWVDDDGWYLTVAEDFLPNTRGGIYKRDFVTISGNVTYLVRLNATADESSNIVIIGEKADNTYEIIGTSTLPKGNNLVDFWVTPTEDYTGLGFIWDSVIPVEIISMYVGDGLWVSNLDKLRDAAEVKVLIQDIDGETTTQLFQGLIAEKPSYEYDGIFENIQIDLEVTDRIRKLDVETGDFVMRNAKIMDYTDKDNSIIHQLAYEAGLTDDYIADIQILTTLSGFAPPSEKSNILSEMDKLCYENGYVLHMDEYDRIHPLPWIIASGISSHTFGETNVIQSISVSESEREFEGVKVIYNELGEKDDVLLYRDDLPRNSDGTFTGYIIPAGYYYPIEANVIDETTGTNQIVYQEYEDSSIKAVTNKAIVEKLDFDARTAMKAFKSDYSAIVATSGHYLEYRIDGGLTPDTVVYNNKKSQVRFNNTTASGVNIYYLNVKGNCLYRTADRYSEVVTVSGSKQIDEYTSSYVFDKTTADTLAQFIAMEQDYGRFIYKFKSDDGVAVGSLVSIVNDARMNQAVLVLERKYNNKEDLYAYTCKGYNQTVGNVTGRNVTRTPIKDSFDVVSLGLSSYALNILSDVNGENLELDDAIITCTALVNGMDYTPDWTFSEATASGVLGSINGNTYTISGMLSDSGYVDILFHKEHYTDKTLRCNVSRIRQGITDYVDDSINIVYETIPVYTPIYLGAHLDDTPSLAKNGDAYLRYSTTSGLDNRGVFTYDGTTWTRTTDPIYVYKALTDIVFICQLKDPDGVALYGAEADYGITSTMETAHIMAAIIDRLRVGDLEIFGTLKSKLLDTINPQTGETINAPTPTYWPGSALVTLCASLADGWHAVDSTSTLDGKNITHAVKGGADNTVSYQASDAEENLKTITSAVNGKVRLYFDYYGYGTLAIMVGPRTVFWLNTTTTTYSTYYIDIDVVIGDVVYNYDYLNSSTHLKNFRLCPTPNTIGLWNNTDNTALSVDDAKYYNKAGTVNINSGTLATASIDNYWLGSELIALFTGKITAYRTNQLGGGTFNSKTCDTIYKNGSDSITLTFTDSTTLFISATGYYSYTGSIILDDVEGKILFGDETAEGQYELWSHNIPGSTDNILTVRNTKSSKPFSIWETRAPDTTAGNDSESTFSLHGVVGTDDYVHDHSMHNYSGDMHFIDGFYNYGGDHVGDWKRVSKRVLTAWEPSTDYGYNALVQNGGNAYVCTYYGTSASSGGPTGTNPLIVDGTCYWRYVGVVTDNVWEYLISEVYSQSGALKQYGGIIPVGQINGDTITDAEIFAAISNTCKTALNSTIQNQRIVSGAIDSLIVSYFYLQPTRVTFVGIQAGVLGSLNCDWNSTTTRHISIAW